MEIHRSKHKVHFTSAYLWNAHDRPRQKYLKYRKHWYKDFWPFFSRGGNARFSTPWCSRYKHPRYHDQKKSKFRNETVKMCAVILELTGCFSERTIFIIYWKLDLFSFFLKNELRETVLQNYFKITLYLSSYPLSTMFYHKGYKWTWRNNLKRGAWTHERLMHSAVRNSYGRLWHFFLLPSAHKCTFAEKMGISFQLCSHK